MLSFSPVPHTHDDTRFLVRYARRFTKLRVGRRVHRDREQLFLAPHKWWFAYSAYLWTDIVFLLYLVFFLVLTTFSHSRRRCRHLDFKSRKLLPCFKHSSHGRRSNDRLSHFRIQLLAGTASTHGNEHNSHTPRRFRLFIRRCIFLQLTLFAARVIISYTQSGTPSLPISRLSLSVNGTITGVDRWVRFVSD